MRCVDLVLWCAISENLNNNDAGLIRDMWKKNANNKIDSKWTQHLTMTAVLPRPHVTACATGAKKKKVTNQTTPHCYNDNICFSGNFQTCAAECMLCNFPHRSPWARMTKKGPFQRHWQDQWEISLIPYSGLFYHHVTIFSFRRSMQHFLCLHGDNGDYHSAKLSTFFFFLQIKK